MGLPICPYCGKENRESALHCYECGTELQLEAPPPVAPPELPCPRLISPKALSAAFTFEDGFHRADWQSVHRWIETHIQPEDAEDAWNEVALLWVSKLRDDLGGDYFVLPSPQTLLLCELPLETANWLLSYAGRVAVAVREQLGNTAWKGACGRNVVLVFSDQDDYYQYVSHYSPDGEQSLSRGICIQSGYTHLALPWGDELDVANAIVHEFTHGCLAHLSLPLWLDEGVALTVQRTIAPLRRGAGGGNQQLFAAAFVDWRPPIVWNELAERHFSFWTDGNIQSFWAGTSFYIPGDSNELSYSLAEIFLKLISEGASRESFRVFLEAAHQDDAGQTAALDVLGIDLGQIAATFLGPGNWRPRRKAMIECWETAGWKKATEPERDAGA